MSALGTNPVDDGLLTVVCSFDQLTADRGVCVVVDGEPVAVFRLSGTDELVAIHNVDPFTGSSVLSRGLVGTTMVGGTWEPYVASPLRKQRFSLRTGACLDDPTASVDTFAVGRDGDLVLVARRVSTPSAL